MLDVASLIVRAGEVAAVVGPPGCGKMALLDLLTGRARPTAGAVRVAGLDPYRDRRRLGERVGVLLAENALYERLSARANLAFHCRVRNLPISRADRVLAHVGLADQPAVRAGKLSPGLARRLAFGRAVLHDPDVLLLAEPLTGCDAASSALLSRLIRERADAGATVLVVTAETVGLADFCQMVHVMEQGRIVRSYEPLQDRQAELPFKIPARQEGEVMLVNSSDILYAATEAGRVCLHTTEARIPTHLTLNDLEQRLAQRGFFRAHRGFLVNLQRVRAVIPYTRDSYTLLLDDAASSEIPLSKASARELRELLDY